MAKTYQLAVQGAYTQAQFDTVAHSLLFASSIDPVYTVNATGGPDDKCIIVTSNVESSAPTGAPNTYLELADDSQSEVAIDIATGKFVEGNLIAVLCPTSEAQSDMRDFVTYFANTGDIHLHVGVCNTTQSQDYTPDIVANSRVIKMMTPAQVKSLNL
jgi:hypothetical protein